MPDEEKRKQEKRSLKKIDDSFTRIIITRDTVKPHYDDDGVYFVPIKAFLLDDDVFEKLK